LIAVRAHPLTWTSCPPDPLAWITWRDLGLHLLFIPWLALPLTAVGLGWSLGLAGVRAWARLSLLLLGMAVFGILYSPISTAALTQWLDRQRPLPTPLPTPVAVLVGRGPQIAQATTVLAAQMQRDGLVQQVYVSGDSRATADQLLRLGVPSQEVFGDDCARTTWENATRTASWLRQQKPPVLAIALISDRWQLPRAALAFQRQGLAVRPMAVALPITASEQNHLALRETAATLLYWVQGRL